MKSILSFSMALFMFTGMSMGQCAEDELGLLVEIVADGYPWEISWEVVDAEGNVYAEGAEQGAQLCIPNDECILFHIYDSYGDGIFDPGGYWLYVDDEPIAQGNDYGFDDSVVIICPPGEACDTAIDVDEGAFEAPAANTWYTFTPAVTGMYEITTCDMADCDTRIWVYDYCEMSNFDDTNEAAIYYDDDEGGCSPQSHVNALLEEGLTYWIRIGDTNGACPGLIPWSIDYGGQPSGCTDPEACNYQPLAEIDDGTCVFPGDPNCTGPDLLVVQEAIENSLYFDTREVSESDCYIDEGCVNGFGTRDILRFTTHIKNIGEVDYYIGPAGNDNPGQFEYDECHNHWHYEGYAEYLVFAGDYSLLPFGFKNGFCVIDLECSGGGTAQYGCANMGISAGCGDIYGAGLDCQWVDMTTVEDGFYTLVVRVNWDQTPDALGHQENGYDNNWAQVCVEITRDTDGDGILNVDDPDIDGDGQLNEDDDDIDGDGQWNTSDGNNRITFQLVEDCPVYTDCNGEEFGTAQIDCNGDCGGTAMMGDLDNNGAQEYQDATTYVDDILHDDIESTTCNDLNQDGDITVTDAALMALCQFYNVAHEHPDSSGVHVKCDFPADNIINPFDSVWLTIADVNWDQNYLDIHVKNPYNRIVGYQLELSGIEITQASSIADPVVYPINPEFLLGGTEVIGLSYEDSSVFKSIDYQPLLRLYFINPEPEVCLSAIIDVVNEDYHNTLNYIENPCVTSVGVNDWEQELGATITPNPWTESTTLAFDNPWRSEHVIQVCDLAGRILRTYGGITGTKVELLREDISAGSYVFRIIGKNNSTGRFVVR